LIESGNLLAQDCLEHRRCYGFGVAIWQSLRAGIGRGSGSASGNATGAIDTSIANPDNSNDTSTGAFSGNASGSYRNVSNQPYADGSVKGKVRIAAPAPHTVQLLSALSTLANYSIPLDQQSLTESVKMDLGLAEL
jgi:hypothetical protein